jgi:hypothetical protein
MNILVSQPEVSDWVIRLIARLTVVLPMYAISTHDAPVQLRILREPCETGCT